MRIAALLIGLYLLSPQAAHVQAHANPGFPAQQMLDVLARPFPNAASPGLPAGYPALYADWTGPQRTAGYNAIAQRCALLFTMEHDNASARMVPEPMTRRDESQLAVGVCLPAHMPADWPKRAEFLDGARQMVARANALGSPLHMPAGVDR